MLPTSVCANCHSLTHCRKHCLPKPASSKGYKLDVYKRQSYGCILPHHSGQNHQLRLTGDVRFGCPSPSSQRGQPRRLRGEQAPLAVILDERSGGEPPLIASPAGGAGAAGGLSAPPTSNFPAPSRRVREQPLEKRRQPCPSMRGGVSTLSAPSQRVRGGRWGKGGCRAPLCEAG